MDYALRGKEGSTQSGSYIRIDQWQNCNTVVWVDDINNASTFPTMDDVINCLRTSAKSVRQIDIVRVTKTVKIEIEIVR